MITDRKYLLEHRNKLNPDLVATLHRQEYYQNSKRSIDAYLPILAKEQQVTKDIFERKEKKQSEEV